MDETPGIKPGFEFEVAELRLEDLERRARSSSGGAALPLKDWIALAEAWRIARALREARGNRSAAARALGIGRRTLYSKMDKLGLVPAWGVARENLARPAVRPGESVAFSAPDSDANLPRD